MISKHLRLSERSERADTVQQTPHDQDHLTTVGQPSLSTSRGQVENPSPDVQVSFQISDMTYL